MEKLRNIFLIGINNSFLYLYSEVIFIIPVSDAKIGFLYIINPCDGAR